MKFLHTIGRSFLRLSVQNSTRSDQRIGWKNRRIAQNCDRTLDLARALWRGQEKAKRAQNARKIALLKYQASLTANSRKLREKAGLACDGLDAANRRRRRRPFWVVDGYSFARHERIDQRRT